MVSGYPPARPVPPGWTMPRDADVAESDDRVRRWERRKAAIREGARPLTFRELCSAIADLMEATRGFPRGDQDLRLQDMTREFDNCVRTGDLTTAWPDGA